MKKLLIVTAMAALASTSFAQVGAVRIRQQTGPQSGQQVERVLKPVGGEQLGFNPTTKALELQKTQLSTAGTGTATFYPEGRLYSTGTAVSTGANTTETTGATYTIPANTLSANGQALRFRVYGTTGATANNKTVQIYFGGTSVYTTGAVAANAKPWFLNLTVIRTAAGAQTIVVEGQFNAAAVAAVTTATKDETTDLIIKNTMTNGTAAATDATTSAANLEYLP